MRPVFIATIKMPTGKRTRSDEDGMQYPSVVFTTPTDLGSQNQPSGIQIQPSSTSSSRGDIANTTALPNEQNGDSSEGGKRGGQRGKRSDSKKMDEFSFEGLYKSL